LIQHPFFKQIKRKDYIIKNILSELPSLEQRPRKQIPHQKQAKITTTDEWDFNENNNEQQNIVPLPQENSKKFIPPKRHISFGDVIVRSNSISGEAPLHPSSSSPPPVGTPPRKSRFVIEENSREPATNTTTFTTHQSTEMIPSNSSHSIMEDENHVCLLFSFLFCCVLFYKKEMQNKTYIYIKKKTLFLGRSHKRQISLESSFKTVARG
jgi:hypothetical protein